MSDRKEHCEDAREEYRETLHEWRQGDMNRHDLNEAYQEYRRECGLGRGQQQIIVLPRNRVKVLIEPDGRFGYNGRWYNRQEDMRGQMSPEQWDEWLDIQRERNDLRRDEIDGHNGAQRQPQTSEPVDIHPAEDPQCPSGTPGCMGKATKQLNIGK